MNAKEISDATLESVTPADNDLMLIYDTSEGTTGKATIADIAPKVAENIDISTLPAVTPADNDLMLIYDVSEGSTGKAPISGIAPKVAENIRITQIILKDSDYIYINPGSLKIFKYGRIVFVISAMMLDASSWDSLTYKVFAKNLPPPIRQCRNIMAMQVNTGRIMGFSLKTNGELCTEQTIAFSKDEISGYWPFSFCYLTNS